MESLVLKVDEILHTDVLIIGGGSSGVLSAYAAGRLGKNVTLIEKNAYLGGISSTILDTFNGFFDSSPDNVQVVKGLPFEVVSRLRNTSTVVERGNTFGSGTVFTYDPECLKCVYDEMMNESGVKVFLHSIFLDAVMEKNNIKGAYILAKEKIIKINAKVVIDASGDAVVAEKSGVPYEMAGDIEPAQTLTTTFRLCNVDIKKAQSISRKELVNLMKEANKSGKYKLPREEGSIHITPYNGVMHAIMTKLDGYNPCNFISLSKAEAVGRSQVREYSRFLKNCVPGFESSCLSYVSTQIGVRETRRIYGQYRLKKEDILEPKKIEDSIGLCATPIEDHSKGTGTKWEFLKKGVYYQIPYRTIIPQKVNNLFVVGRCFSATHIAHASCRSIAQTMLMGQAAGVAADICVNDETTPGMIDITKLQNKLIELGNII